MATFKSSGTDKDVKVQPTGTGKVVVGTGAAAATVTSDGDNDLVLQTGNATTGSITVTDGANGDISLTPNGTGSVVIPNAVINGGTIDNTTIGGATPAAGTFTTFTSTGIDDNASSTALTIDSSGNLKFNSGYGSVATAYGCRAWVNFDGTSGSGTGSSDITIRGSGNVSSITDNGTGLYTINFSSAMPDANYAVAGIGRDGTNAVVNISLRYNVVPATSYLAINTTQSGSFKDLDYANIIVIR